MVFTVPISPDKPTLDEGETGLTDMDRYKMFGQKDHIKRFGYDFFDVFKCMKCEFTTIRPTAEVSDEISSRDPVYCYKKIC